MKAFPCGYVKKVSVSIPIANRFTGKRGASLVFAGKARRRGIAAPMARRRNAAGERERRASWRKDGYI